MHTILFVGSNPSNASTCEVAFHGSTKSSKILTDWTRDIQGMKVHINVLNEKTENNRPLKTSEIKSNLTRLAEDIKATSPTRIVALGKTAAKALTLLQLDFYEMPHPSGRNRKLNDPAYVQEKVKGLLEFCSSSPNTDSVETSN
jgi:uracil-DNA glycosylase